MDKQNVILKSQEITQGLRVIGMGRMINESCQIGEWWVMPADQYSGIIPEEVVTQWVAFKLLNIPVVGYVIADDMRAVLLRREKEAEERERQQQEAQLQQSRLDAELEAQRQELLRKQRREEFNRKAKQVAEVGGKALVGVGTAVGVVAAGLAAVAIGAVTVAAGTLLAILRFDPILIAVLPDGRWIYIAEWWE